MICFFFAENPKATIRQRPTTKAPTPVMQRDAWRDANSPAAADQGEAGFHVEHISVSRDTGGFPLNAPGLSLIWEMAPRESPHIPAPSVFPLVWVSKFRPDRPPLPKPLSGKGLLEVCRLAYW